MKKSLFLASSNSFILFSKRMKQVTFLLIFILSVSTNLKAQLTYEFSTGSDTVDFGQVKIGDSAIVDVTVSLSEDAVDDYYVFQFHSLFYNHVLPDSALSKANVLYDADNYGNTSGCSVDYGEIPFDFRDANGDPLPSQFKDTIAPGSSIMLKVVFKPTSFEFYEYLGTKSVCAGYNYEYGYCEFYVNESICSETSTASEGIGDYEFTMKFEVYTDNLGPVYKTFIVQGEGLEDEATGLFSSNDLERLAIYPNPATSILNTEVGQIKIVDALGNPVLSTESNGKVDISNLESGIYIVTQNNKRTKLIKE